MPETASFRPAAGEWSAAGLTEFLAEVFASLDARPRPLRLAIASPGGGVLDVPDFRGRWLPEHPVPLAFPKRGRLVLMLTPTTGNRVKVRRASFWERILP